MSETPSPIHISLVAIPDSMALPVNGIYETLCIFEHLNPLDVGTPLFNVEIVGRERGPLQTPTGLPIQVHRSFDEIEHTDIVIATSMAADENDEWITNRYPDAVTWLQAMHRAQAVLCSSCTGVLLVAETGLLNGLTATIHWAYAPTFARNFPAVRLDIREVLVSGGNRHEFVMAGATSSWQDLVLYLVGRCAGHAAAQAVGNFMLFQWHRDTQAPYVSFSPSSSHGDATIRELQGWLVGHCSIASPVNEMTRRSGLSEATLKRRFRQSTGYSPIQYVQRLRIEDAKRRLEATDAPVDQIGWQVGYEDPAFFRRLFKRITRMTPSEYRRKFQIPEFARAAEA